MVFNKELDFEKALIKVLCTKGWESDIIKNPTEEDLIKNWANILFENNRNINTFSTSRKILHFTSICSIFDHWFFKFHVVI